MHISEGVLSAPILLGGGALAAVGTYIGFRKMDYDRVMTVAVLSAAFFVASLVHIPIGPSNVHLVLNGLLGLFLGWAAFPSILVALLLQAVLFQFGGITALGVNTLNMALPAVICFYVFRPLLARGKGSKFLAAFGCGFAAVALSALMTAASLAFTDEGFLQAAKVLFVSHLPVMVAEGFITAFAYAFFLNVKPEIFPANK